MSRRIDETGRTYGRLTVLTYAYTDGHGGAHWRCTCACGNTVIVDGHHLRSGAVRSCGCLSRELTSVRRRATANPLKGTKEATAFSNMHRRCEQPTHNRFHRYGGRGIKVCARWSGDDGLKNFLDDMGPCPDGCSLDRINVDGDYEPSNCRWADRYTQANNTTRNVHLTLDGETRTLSEWGRRLNINYATICKRLRTGRTVEEALHKGRLPVRRKRT